MEQDAVQPVTTVEVSERLARRVQSAQLVVGACVALAVMAAGFLIPAGDELAGGGKAPTPETRTTLDTHLALLKRCNDRETWAPAYLRRAEGNLWETFVRVQAARAEARYCEQFLGGQHLAQLFGLAPRR